MYNTKNKKIGDNLSAFCCCYTHTQIQRCSSFIFCCCCCLFFFFFFFSNFSFCVSLLYFFFLSRAAAAELSKFITRGVDATNGYVARSSFASHDLAHERKSFLFRLFPKMKKEKKTSLALCVWICLMQPPMIVSNG